MELLSRAWSLHTGGSERMFERVDVDLVPRIWVSVELVRLTPREQEQRRTVELVEVALPLDAPVSHQRE